MVDTNGFSAGPVPTAGAGSSPLGAGSDPSPPPASSNNSPGVPTVRRMTRSKTRDESMHDAAMGAGALLRPDQFQRTMQRSHTRPEAELIERGNIESGPGAARRSLLRPNQNVALLTNSRQGSGDIGDNSRRPSCAPGPSGSESWQQGQQQSGSEEAAPGPGTARFGPVRQSSFSPKPNFKFAKGLHQSRIWEEKEQNNRVLKNFLDPSTRLQNSGSTTQLEKIFHHGGGHVLEHIHTVVNEVNAVNEIEPNSFRSWFSRKRLFLWLFLEEPFLSSESTFYSLCMIVLVFVGFFTAVVAQEYDTTTGEFIALQPPAIESGKKYWLPFIINLIFTLEIITRFAVAPMKSKFMSQAINVIDILAVLPFWLNNTMQLHTVMEFSRYLSIFSSVFWLVKLCRFFPGWYLLSRALRSSVAALLIPIQFLLLIVMLGASMILAFDWLSATIHGNPMSLKTWGAAFQYVMVVTISIDVSPVYDTKAESGPSQAIAVCMMYLGVIFMSMPIAIVGTCFSQTWFDQDRIVLVEKVRSRMRQQGYTTDDLREVFDEVDEDGSGEIEFYEFKRMLEAFHFYAPMGKTRKLFNHFDTNGTGSISYQEFVCVIFPEITDIVDWDYGRAVEEPLEDIIEEVSEDMSESSFNSFSDASSSDDMSDGQLAQGSGPFGIRRIQSMESGVSFRSSRSRGGSRRGSRGRGSTSSTNISPMSKIGEKVAEAAKAAIRRGSSMVTLGQPNDESLLGNNIVADKGIRRARSSDLIDGLASGTISGSLGLVSLKADQHATSSRRSVKPPARNSGSNIIPPRTSANSLVGSDGTKTFSNRLSMLDNRNLDGTGSQPLLTSSMSATALTVENSFTRTVPGARGSMVSPAIAAASAAFEDATPDLIGTKSTGLKGRIRDIFATSGSTQKTGDGKDASIPPITKMHSSAAASSQKASAWSGSGPTKSMPMSGMRGGKKQDSPINNKAPVLSILTGKEIPSSANRTTASPSGGGKSTKLSDMHRPRNNEHSRDGHDPHQPSTGAVAGTGRKSKGIKHQELDRLPADDQGPDGAGKTQKRAYISPAIASVAPTNFQQHKPNPANAFRPGPGFGKTGGPAMPWLGGGGTGGFGQGPSLSGNQIENLQSVICRVTARVLVLETQLQQLSDTHKQSMNVMQGILPTCFSADSENADGSGAAQTADGADAAKGSAGGSATAAAATGQNKNLLQTKPNQKKMHNLGITQMRRGSNRSVGSRNASRRGSAVSSRRGSFQVDPTASQNRRGSFDRVVAVLNLDKILSDKPEKKLKTGIISANDFNNSAFAASGSKSGDGASEKKRPQSTSAETHKNSNWRPKANMTINTDIAAEPEGRLQSENQPTLLTTDVSEPEKVRYID